MGDPFPRFTTLSISNVIRWRENLMRGLYLPLLLCVSISLNAAQRISVCVLPMSNGTAGNEAAHWRHTIPVLLATQLHNVAELQVSNDRWTEFQPDSSIEFAFSELHLAFGSA